MFNKQNINAEQELSVMTVMGIYLHLKRFHACNGCGKMIVVIIFFRSICKRYNRGIAWKEHIRYLISV